MTPHDLRLVGVCYDGHLICYALVHKDEMAGDICKMFPCDYRDIAYEAADIAGLIDAEDLPLWGFTFREVTRPSKDLRLSHIWLSALVERNLPSDADNYTALHWFEALEKLRAE